MQKNKYIDSMFLYVDTRREKKIAKIISLVVRNHRYIQLGHATDKRNAGQAMVIPILGAQIKAVGYNDTTCENYNEKR